MSLFLPVGGAAVFDRLSTLFPVRSTPVLDRAFELAFDVRNTQAGNAHGSFPWNVDHRLAPLLADQLRRYRDHYPAVTAAVDAATESDARDFGLRCILDGIEVFIAALPRSGPA